MNRVLFVCLGNICRSPAAAAVFAAKALARDVEVTVSSAGTGGWHAGEGADPRMIAAASRRGYSLDRHRARQVDLSDFYDFDVLLAMDLRNQADLFVMAPPDRKCDIRLFLDFADTKARETPDPFYGEDKGFERVLDLIEAGADGFLAHLEESGS